MNVVDHFLNRHTPYSFMLHGLWILVGISFFESIFNWLPYTPIQLFFSLIILIGVTAATNSACALITGANPSRESSRITALMLFFALSAPQSATDALLLMLAGALAILSKYIFSVRKLHVGNPAAVALLILAIAAPAIVTWWVGTAVLFPFVLILGLLAVRKMHNADVVWLFILATALVLAGETFLSSNTPNLGYSHMLIGAYVKLVLASPFLFVGLLMLSDPHTMPRTPNKGIRSLYGAIVGALYPLSTFPLMVTFAGSTASPQLALVVGNIAAFCADSVTRVRNRLTLTLQKTMPLSRDTFEFSMLPVDSSSSVDLRSSVTSGIASRPLTFLPGQSIEITLPHRHADYRGIRRTFVLTSAPSDHYLTFCTTIPIECSTFKETLHTMQLALAEKDAPVKKLSFSVVGPLGDPFFPKDPNKKVLCLASGIGVASFMSYFRELAHNNERRDSVLLYSATSPLDFIYKEELDSFSTRIGLKIIYAPLDYIELAGRWEGLSGSITDGMIKKNVPDYASRCWFMAGPVQNTLEYKKIAHSLEMPTESIQVQEYPGF